MKYINLKSSSKQSKQIKKPYTLSFEAGKDPNEELLATIVSTLSFHNTWHKGHYFI